MIPRTVAIGLTAAGFVVLAPLLVLVGARLVGYDESVYIVLAQTFTPYIFLPAYVVFLAAALTRRRVLGILAAVVVLCHIFWVFPEFRPATDLPADASSAPSISLYSHNTLAGNAQLDELAAVIKRRSPDFLLLQELSFGNANELRALGAFDAYEYSYAEPASGPSGIGMWSKHPLEQESIVWVNDFPVLRAIAAVHDKRLVLWNVHTHPPIGGGPFQYWEEDLDEMRDLLHSERGDVLAAGDFNATWSHAPYRALVDYDYRDAHIDRGRGYARTWPMDRGLAKSLGGVIRIDHVLTRGAIRPTHIEEDPASGSDHRAVYATFGAALTTEL